MKYYHHSEETREQIHSRTASHRIENTNRDHQLLWLAFGVRRAKRQNMQKTHMENREIEWKQIKAAHMLV